jgi:hypothetical protein
VHDNSNGGVLDVSGMVSGGSMELYGNQIYNNTLTQPFRIFKCLSFVFFFFFFSEYAGSFKTTTKSLLVIFFSNGR